MKILVTFALENEFAPWRKLRGFNRICVDEWDNTYRSRLGDADLRVILTGAGRFAAQRAIAEAFNEVPDICIASGLAGALRPAYAPGDVLVARRVTKIRGGRSFLCDSDLTSVAADTGAKSVEGFLSSDGVVASVEEKQEFAKLGDAVDMESVYVLEAAMQHEVRAVAIRAISDAADSTLPLNFDEVFNERGTVSIPKIVGQLVVRPNRIAGLLRLAHESERAAGALARFLDEYVQRLAPRPFPEIAKAEALAI